MSNISHSAKKVFNKLQNKSSKVSINELNSILEEHFPTEDLADKAHSHMSDNIEISCMEVTEDWFRSALPQKYDGPDIHELIEDYTEKVYEQATN